MSARKAAAGDVPYPLPEGWRWVRLGEVISPSGSRVGDRKNIPVYSVTKHAGFVPSDEYFTKKVHGRDISKYKVVEPGDFAYATIHLDEGSIGISPVCSAISPMYTVFKVNERAVDPMYLIEYMKSSWAMKFYELIGQGAVHRRKSISLTALSSMEVPLPPLSEQRRIADILDIVKGQAVVEGDSVKSADLLLGSLFENTFSSRGVEEFWLGDLALVTSGITKGRKTSAPTMLTPYLAVSNVQAGALALDSVKEIAATEEEVERYRLARGDLLLTEGGDPDKLGRGTLWREEISPCLHQNHVFRVRIKDETYILPEYLAGFVASRKARAYFLRSAKQTTGIASINMTQLKGLSVPVPSIELQQEYVRQLNLVRGYQSHLRRRRQLTGELFSSLRSRAFRGEL